MSSWFSINPLMAIYIYGSLKCLHLFASSDVVSLGQSFSLSTRPVAVDKQNWIYYHSAISAKLGRIAITHMYSLAGSSSVSNTHISGNKGGD